MVLDATKPWYHKEILTRELESVGMRLNRQVSAHCCLSPYSVVSPHLPVSNQHTMSGTSESAQLTEGGWGDPSIMRILCM